MKYYIIAGEASGDLHGSNLIKELKALDGTAQIRCWGGEKMQEAGATLVKHYAELAFMGFVEVLKNLRTIFRNLSDCKKDITQYQPDVLVLIDYPGFNLRIASWAKKNGLRVIYYISPQVWAWKESRVRGIKKNVDKKITGGEASWILENNEMMNKGLLNLKATAYKRYRIFEKKI